MELTEKEVLDRLYGFLTHARRVQELKDSLLYFQMFGDEQTLRQELKSHEDIYLQIDEVYHEKMIPLVDDIVDFLVAHPAEVEELLLAE